MPRSFGNGPERTPMLSPVVSRACRGPCPRRPGTDTPAFPVVVRSAQGGPGHRDAGDPRHGAGAPEVAATFNRRPDRGRHARGYGVRAAGLGARSSSRAASGSRSSCSATASSRRATWCRLRGAASPSVSATRAASPSRSRTLSPTTRTPSTTSWGSSPCRAVPGVPDGRAAGGRRHDRAGRGGDGRPGLRGASLHQHRGGRWRGGREPAAAGQIPRSDHRSGRRPAAACLGDRSRRAGTRLLSRRRGRGRRRQTAPVRQAQASASLARTSSRSR